MKRLTCPNCGAEDKSVHVGPDEYGCPVCGHHFCTAAGLEADEFWRNVRRELEVSTEEG